MLFIFRDRVKLSSYCSLMLFMSFRMFTELTVLVFNALEGAFAFAYDFELFSVERLDLPFGESYRSFTPEKQSLMPLFFLLETGLRLVFYRQLGL